MAARKKSAKKKPINKKKSVKKKAVKAAPKPTKRAASKKVTKKKPAKKTAAVKKTTAKKSAPPKKALLKKSSSRKSALKSAPKKAAKTHDWAKMFHPLEDRIVVEQDPMADQTAGGIYVPMGVDEGSTQGKVLAVGAGKRSKKGLLRPTELRPGDRILFNNFAGTKVSIDGRDIVVLREDEVWGVVN